MTVFVCPKSLKRCSYRLIHCDIRIRFNISLFQTNVPRNTKKAHFQNHEALGRNSQLPTTLFSNKAGYFLLCFENNLIFPVFKMGKTMRSKKASTSKALLCVENRKFRHSDARLSASFKTEFSPKTYYRSRIRKHPLNACKDAEKIFLQMLL